MRLLPRGLALLLVLALLLGQGLESFHQHEDEVPVGFAWTVSHCWDHPSGTHLEPDEPAPEICLTCTLLAQAADPAVQPPALFAFGPPAAATAAPVDRPSLAVPSLSRGRAPPTSSC